MQKRSSTTYMVRIAGGAAAGIALFFVLRRLAQGFQAPQPELCRGFEDDTGRIRCVNLGVTTVYLIKASDGYLLIDTGYPTDYATFREALDEQDIDLKEIKYLLLTHSHDDHAGFAAQLITETGAQTIVHKDAVDPLEKGSMDFREVRPLNWRITALTGLYSLFLRRDFHYPPVKLSESDIRIVGDDPDFLKTIGIDGEIITTPGHTADSISVVLSDGKVFCGDAAMNFLDIAGTHHRPIFIADTAQVFASWEKMLDKDADVFYPAHGAPFKAEELAQSLKKYTT